MVKELILLEKKLPNCTTAHTNDLLKWFSESIGLIGSRDSEKSCFRVFIQLLKESNKSGVKSDDLAIATNITRGTAVHHLHNLIKRGIVVHDKNTYSLRENSFTELVFFLRADTIRFFNKLEKIATELDKKLDLKDLSDSTNSLI